MNPFATPRQARTRADTGEATRDQRRERERIGRVACIEGGKPQWVCRGVQPEVRPAPEMVFSRLANLAREIREEPDLRERARLEARYRELSAGITDLCLDPREVHLRETCTELLGVFAPILSGADMREPETWQRHEWAAFHRQLVIIRKRSAAWLNTSRRFGSERWGASFAAAAEAEPTTAPTSNNSIE